MNPVLRNAAGVVVELLANGAIRAIRHEEILVNQVLGSPVEGGIGNLYLRRRTRSGVAWFPLLGPGSASRFRTASDAATWDGSVEGIDYACQLRLARDAPSWFWSVEIVNRTGRRISVDAVFAQDLGLAREDVVRSSELYVSQYIDHTVLEDDELGFLVCSRQNLPQDGAHPWLMQGCLDGAAGFLTDGFQFYGLGYRTSNVAAALERPKLPNRTYQYEFALPAIQARPRWIRADARTRLTFFATFAADHPAATSPGDLRRAGAAARAFHELPPAGEEGVEHPRSAGRFDAPVPFVARGLGPADLDRFFGTGRRLLEQRNGTLLSFFAGHDRHVVLQAKELAAERPTGHIMRSGRDLGPSDDLLAVTAWMSGAFATHLAIGNTSFNTLLSVARNPLNVLKASGQRIFLRTDGDWELLAEPSAFEMTPGSARWIYQGDRLTLVVRVEASPDAPACRISVEVERGGPVELLVSHHLALGGEDGASGEIEVDAAAGSVMLRPPPTSLVRERYPETTFHIVTPHPERVAATGGDELLHDDGQERGDGYVVIRTRPVESFTLVLTGSVLSRGQADKRAARYRSAPRADGEADTAAEFWPGLAGNLQLAGGSAGRADDLARLNEVLPWFVHDALIHYTTPHGLEQHSGAAWGVRDVCQGPAELLVATGHAAQLRDVLKTVYSHQYRGTGDWPQWFMFDRYAEIQAPDSHADVIHWPLKALCDYVEATDDLSILDEALPYTDEASKRPTDEAETVFTHTERQLDRIEAGFLPGTSLVAFGGGDWEDTLQPADPAMAERMVSAWTVELAYQTLGRYRAVCERAGRSPMANRLADLCARMRADFHRHLVPDGVVAGLAHFGADGIEYFLHPRDRHTGASYRLLPMTRGIISGIFEAEQVDRHVELIHRHLTFPDGVRLMDRPMEYRGGTSRWFRRAESAANFGREVGLQYVHAHIRYIEAMASAGRPAEALWGLMAVCPIRIDLTVPSALPRQANAYFSSSDADFLDRHQALRQFDRVQRGTVGVKGGWRVYSSGPGIYLNQLVSSVLGLRRRFDELVVDPVLPRDLDGLTVDRQESGRRVRYRYRITGDGFGTHQVAVNGRALPARRAVNPYRTGGLLVAVSDFEVALDRAENEVEVRL